MCLLHLAAVVGPGWWLFRGPVRPRWVGRVPSLGSVPAVGFVKLTSDLKSPSGDSDRDVNTSRFVMAPTVHLMIVYLTPKPLGCYHPLFMHEKTQALRGLVSRLKSHSSQTWVLPASASGLSYVGTLSIFPALGAVLSRSGGNIVILHDGWPCIHSEVTLMTLHLTKDKASSVSLPSGSHHWTHPTEVEAGEGGPGVGSHNQ